VYFEYPWRLLQLALVGIAGAVDALNLLVALSVIL
jgi:hypothetical protein